MWSCQLKTTAAALGWVRDWILTALGIVFTFYDKMPFCFAGCMVFQQINDPKNWS